MSILKKINLIKNNFLIHAYLISYYKINISNVKRMKKMIG